MPPKIRELIADLERAEFRDRGGRGSHRTTFILKCQARLLYRAVWDRKPIDTKHEWCELH